MAGGSLRERRREQRRALSREQILDAAEEVFARAGFHDASLREIAELAEFSVGSVYSFFPGKDALYRDLFRRRGEEFMPEMRRILAGSAAPRRQLLELADWQVGFFRLRPHFGRLVLRGGAVAPPLAEPSTDPQLTENFKESQRLQADLFERGQRAGELRDGPPLVLARMFSGLVSAYQTAEMEEGGEPMPAEEFHALLEAAFVVA